ncbi:GSCFA domain-containing protein [Echinicola jeungdonensis]|uniref:GSCFA domain-containing protein n=1 Tax=Echinicola jeungdonensis TaxID=709343 RepID=A0ABV5J6X7_9BACT|nr:GSCFA domain-containing protein [Echinicola jeungdonensis]MDN3670775.1 GSCFA domain-containing protein [Echinicola jeungdonensis]
MSTFRSELKISKNPTKIEKGSKILSMGSGFSSMMAENLMRYGLNISNNPFGRVYNPISIFNLLEIAGNHVQVDEKQITEYDGNWNHFQFNFLRRRKSPEDLLNNINIKVEQVRKEFFKNEFLILSFGSAFVFRHKETKQVVANCHKAPQHLFEKELLSTEQILKAFRHIYPQLNHFKDIILVLSPVMHTKDSITLNQVSKSVLRVAMHQIVSEFPEVKYFPAYEFLISDLRDYRFYERDFLQPNQMASDYITSKFNEAYFDPQLYEISKEMDDILHGVESIPYNPQSRDFVFEVNSAIKSLQELDSKIDTRLAINLLEAKINQD